MKFFEAKYKQHRLLQILVGSLMATALIVGLVVALTAMNSQGRAHLAGASERHDREIEGPAVDFETISFAQLNLPESSQNLSPESLTKQLLQLAETLKTQYSANVASHHIAAQIYFGLSEMQRATESFQQAMVMNRDKLGPYLGLGEIYLQSARDSEAIKILKLAVDRGLRSDLLFRRLAQAYENEGDIEGALLWLKRSEQLDPRSVDTLKAISRVQIQLRDYESAESSIRRAISIGGESESVLYTLANVLARQDRVKEAAEIREQMQKTVKETSNEDTSAERGFQADYQHALERIAYDMQLSAASIAIQNGDDKQAEKWVRQSIAVNPRPINAYAALANIFMKQSRLAEGIAIYEFLVERQPENILYRFNLATLRSQAGMKEYAQETLADAVAKDPEGSVSLIRLLIGRRDGESATRMAVKLLERHPNAESYALLAAAYETSGKRHEAAATIQQAQQHWPDHPMWQTVPGAGAGGNSVSGTQPLGSSNR